MIALEVADRQLYEALQYLLIPDAVKLRFGCSPVLAFEKLVAEDVLLSEAALGLGDAEYVACTAGAEQRIFLNDGMVSYRGGRVLVRSGCASPEVPHGFPFYALSAGAFWALAQQQGLVLHSLVFEYRGRCVLGIAGSGVGKTTLALAALAAGARLVTDDRALLSADGDGLRVDNLRSFMQLRPQTLSVFQGLLQAVGVTRFLPGEGSTQRIPIEDIPGQYCPSCQVDWIWVLRQRDGRPGSVIGPANTADAAAAIAAQSGTYLWSSRAGMELLSRILSLTASVRVSDVRIGTRLLERPVEEFNTIFHGD